MRETTAGKVLQHYYELRQKRGPKPPGFFRDRVWDHANAFLAWAAEQELDDPLRYLDYRFAVGDHNGRIPNIAQLRSVKLAALYRSEWKQGGRDAADGYDFVKRRSGTKREQAVKALRILTGANEVAKSHYVGRAELCRAQSDMTGGYHPESRYCPTCPQAVRCAAQLHQTYGFDIVALRAGRLKYLPKEVAAAAIS